MKPLLTTIIAASLLGLSGCGKSADEPPQPRSTQGREETRNIRDTEAVGYSGDAVANQVDAALDANDQRKEQLDEELNQQEQ